MFEASLKQRVLTAIVHSIKPFTLFLKATWVVLPVVGLTIYYI